MRRFKTWLPALALLLIAAIMLVHGPIAQPPHYHDFADARGLACLPNFANVASNAGFLVVGGWGLWFFRYPQRRAFLGTAWHGYAVFLAGVALTALGSGYYHLAPDNDRLFWDRLPIAIACAGLLAAGFAQTFGRIHRWALPMLLVAACMSVFWWSLTEQHGSGDLRPYLLLQIAPLVMIPLWQWSADAAKRDRIAFGVAVLLYVLAKLAELQDRDILDVLGWMSGHTAKHLLAFAATLVLTANIVCRASRQPASERARLG